MNDVMLIAGMALVTFIIRYAMFAASSRMALSKSVLRALHYVPPVVLTAIVAPAVLMPTGETLDISLTNARLFGAIAACLIGWYTRSLMLTIVLGMAVFFAWRWGVMVWG